MYPIRCEYVRHADLSGVDRYFCFWNFFSRPISCNSVKMVRLRRGFFRRGVLRSVSDSLLMLSGVRLGEGSERCCGESRGRCEGTPPGDGDWGRWVVKLGGCRVITERSGYARSDEEPGTAETVRQITKTEKCINAQHSESSEITHPSESLKVFTELLWAPQSPRLHRYRSTCNDLDRLVLIAWCLLWKVFCFWPPPCRGLWSRWRMLCFTLLLWTRQKNDYFSEVVKCWPTSQHEVTSTHTHKDGQQGAHAHADTPRQQNTCLQPTEEGRRPEVVVAQQSENSICQRKMLWIQIENQSINQICAHTGRAHILHNTNRPRTHTC